MKDTKIAASLVYTPCERILMREHLVAVAHTVQLIQLVQ